MNPVIIDFNEISEDDIKNIFSKFDTKKGTSFNSVSGKILKENGNIYYDTLTKTVNNSINKNNYPYRLKFADINPTFNPGKKDRTDIGNYRPISVLPYASKLYERLMKNQIQNSMKDILHPNLCGYREGFSVQHALISM